jgi:hypothetical protein
LVRSGGREGLWAEATAGTRRREIEEWEEMGKEGILCRGPVCTGSLSRPSGCTEQEFVCIESGRYACSITNICYSDTRFPTCWTHARGRWHSAEETIGLRALFIWPVRTIMSIRDTQQDRCHQTRTGLAYQSLPDGVFGVISNLVLNADTELQSPEDVMRLSHSAFSSLSTAQPSPYSTKKEVCITAEPLQHNRALRAQPSPYSTAEPSQHSRALAIAAFPHPYCHYSAPSTKPHIIATFADVAMGSRSARNNVHDA